MAEPRKTPTQAGSTLPALDLANYGRNMQAAVDTTSGELLLRIKIGAEALARAPMAKGTPQKPGKNKLLA